MEITWIRIPFFQCGSRIRIRIHIKIKWIPSTACESCITLQFTKKFCRSRYNTVGTAVGSAVLPFINNQYLIFLFDFYVKICSKCVTKIKLPSDNLREIPVSILTHQLCSNQHPGILSH